MEGRSAVPCFGVEGKSYPRTHATQANLTQTQVLVIDIDKTTYTESDIYHALRENDIEPSIISHSWSHHENMDANGNKLGCYHLHYIFGEPIYGVQEAKTKLMYIYHEIERILGAGTADNKVTNPAGVINGCVDGSDYHYRNGYDSRPIYQSSDFVGVVASDKTHKTTTKVSATKAENPQQQYNATLIRDSIRVIEGVIDANTYRLSHIGLRWIYRQEPDRLHTRKNRDNTHEPIIVGRTNMGAYLPQYVAPQPYILTQSEIQPRVWDIDPDTYWRLPYHKTKLQDGSKRYSILLQRAVVRIVGARRYEGMRDVTPDETLFNLVCDVLDFCDLSDGKYANIQRIMSIANDAHSMPTEDQDSMHDTYLRSRLNIVPKGGKVAQRGIRVDSEYKAEIIQIVAYQWSPYLTMRENCDILNVSLAYYGIVDVIVSERAYKQYLSTLRDMVRQQDDEGVLATTPTQMTDDELWGVICELGVTIGNKRLATMITDKLGHKITEWRVQSIKRQHATT